MNTNINIKFSKMKYNYTINSNINIVSIFYWGRSGSFFVGSLLDNHKNTLTIPGAYIYQFYDKNGFWNKMMQKENINLNILLDDFCKETEGMFDGKKDTGTNLSAMGKHGNICIKVSIKLFKKYMKKISKNHDLLNRKNFFIAIHYAYELSLGHDVSKKTIINYQFHVPDKPKLEDFILDFPDSKYIGTLRDPIRSLYSQLRIRKEDMTKRDDKTYEEYHTVYNGLYLHYYTQQLYGWKIATSDLNLNLLPVQLEHLHDTPKKTVEKIAKFIGIKFKKSLLKSTFCGLKYWGDPNAIQKIDGFSSRHTRKSNSHNCFSKNLKY